MVPKVYLETSLISYLAAPMNRYVWWDSSRHAFEIVVSAYVLEECSLGHPDLVVRRTDIIAQTTTLGVDPAIPELAALLIGPYGPIPVGAATDALHIAAAAFYDCRFLLTWNFRRMANAYLRPKVDNILRNRYFGAPRPTLEGMKRPSARARRPKRPPQAGGPPHFASTGAEARLICVSVRICLGEKAQ